MAFERREETRGTLQPSQGFFIDWKTRQACPPTKRGRKMLATAGMLLGAIAVVCVMLEATWPAVVFGAVAYWMASHGA